jgi:hypothetical protein
MWEKKYLYRVGQAMRFASWVTQATNTHPEYVTFIAFPLQQ